MEAVTFRLDEDFKVKVGKDQSEITVPRLTFGHAKVVQKLIGSVIGDAESRSVESLGRAAKANATMSPNAYKDFAKFIREAIPILVEANNWTVIKELLMEVSEGAIDEKTILSMQFSEAANLLVYLLDGNFASLKNLHASLQAIYSSGK